MFPGKGWSKKARDAISLSSELEVEKMHLGRRKNKQVKEAEQKVSNGFWTTSLNVTEEVPNWWKEDINVQ